MPRMKPLAVGDCPDPELKAVFRHFEQTLGFVPTSRRPSPWPRPGASSPTRGGRWGSTGE